MLNNELEADFAFACDDIAALAGTHVLVSGGTGFVGSWLLELIAWGNRRCDARISLEVISRNPAEFARRCPHLATADFVKLVKADVRTVTPDGTYDAVIHAATEASATELATAPARMLDTIVRGGEAMLAAASRCGSIPFLFTSSGAVYGRQPLDLKAIPETYAGGPDPLDPASAYAEGKRFAELQCALAAANGVRPKIARLFAFVGPYLPLDRHFAIGNFIADALAGRPIRIAGDGSPIRSYLYGSEMAVWLLAILVRGQALRAYNVGSDEAFELSQVASIVAKTAGSIEVAIATGAHFPGAGARYVPAIDRGRTELSLARRIGLEDAIRRTIDFHR